MHKIKVVRYGEDEYITRCEGCGWKHPGSTTNRQEAEDWIAVHEKQIERIRTHLGTKTPSLKSERDHYLDKSVDPYETAENRAIWKQLADELSTRLNDEGTDPDRQPRLF